MAYSIIIAGVPPDRAPLCWGLVGEDGRRDTMLLVPGLLTFVTMQVYAELARYLKMERM
jgi:hypothetical protein